MKNRIVKVIAAALIAAAVCTPLAACERVTYNDRITRGTVTFFEETSALTKEDAEVMFGLFDGQVLYRDDPSCGFSEEVSVSFNDGAHVFWFAQDSCPIVYYKNSDKYLSLSDREQRSLYSILKKYGFRFPCV